MAVERVDELYAIGLPEGLPGGLATVALNHHDEELVERVKAVRFRTDALVVKREAQLARKKQQGKMRAAGAYDRRTGMQATAVEAAIEAGGDQVMEPELCVPCATMPPPPALQPPPPAPQLTAPVLDPILIQR